MADGPRNKNSSHQSEKRHTRFMDVEDARLWNEVRKSVHPLVKSGRTIGHGAGDVTEDDPQADLEREFRRAMGEQDTPAKADAADAKQTASGEKTSPVRQNRLPPVPGAIDRRERRRLVTGQLDIEARLDLHGHRQHEAYDELKAFVLRCRARGLRHVLVITGKGSRGPEEEKHLYLSESGRGILKRQVPLWLAQPDLAQHIVGFEQAHTRHGGEGALYVRLRRR